MSESLSITKGDRMGIIKSLNAKILRPLNTKNEDVAQHILNRKANAKLNYISGVFDEALKGHWEVIEDGFLFKKIGLKDIKYINDLKISYFLQNRFFARTYDLRFELEIPSNREEEAKFELAYSGKMKISGAKFNLSSGGPEDLKLLQRLNSDFVKDRLLKLDFLDFKISYSARKQKWYITADSIIGSATWNLLPPMFQVIKPTFKECIMMIELFQLISEAIVNNIEGELKND
jgi:hypothetical protein